jgi:hypothetical protein
MEYGKQSKSEFDHRGLDSPEAKSLAEQRQYDVMQVLHEAALPEMKTEQPLTQSCLLRRCLFEVGIGAVAAVAVVVLRGGWRLFQDWISCATCGGIILAAATILAVRDYRKGVKIINSYEEERLWGRRHDDAVPDQHGKD